MDGEKKHFKFWKVKKIIEKPNCITYKHGGSKVKLMKELCNKNMYFQQIVFI